MLRLLGERRDGGQTLAELGRATGVPVSSLISIVGSLEAGGLLRRLPSKRYVLDIGVLTLGQAYAEGSDLASSLLARFLPVGQALIGEFDETVQLGVLVESDVAYIARQESSQPVRLVAKVGRRIPAHASALGKTLLSTLSSTELRALLGEEPLARLTPRTITDYETLDRELRNVRTHGFSESREECILGLHCISAPIVDRTGSVVAGIAISTPVFRMTTARRREMCDRIVAAAHELSETADEGEERKMNSPHPWPQEKRSSPKPTHRQPR